MHETNSKFILIQSFNLFLFKSQSISNYFNSLKVVPVAISYEFDPNDLLKAKELHSADLNSEYIKERDEDLKSIANGITGFKKNYKKAIVTLKEGNTIDSSMEIK